MDYHKNKPSTKRIKKRERNGVEKDLEIWMLGAFKKWLK